MAMVPLLEQRLADLQRQHDDLARRLASVGPLQEQLATLQRGHDEVATRLNGYTTAGLNKLQFQSAQTLWGGGATILVAASGAHPNAKARADYVCDGTADDVEIQAAIDALIAAGGGKIVLSSGTFNIETSLRMATGVVIEGQGYGHYPYDGSAGGTILNKAANINLVTATDVHAFGLRNLSLYGDKTSYTGKGLFVEGTGAARPKFWFLDRVMISRMDGVSVDVNQGAMHWITNSRIIEGNADLIALTDASDYLYAGLDIGGAVGASSYAINIGATSIGRISDSKLFECEQGITSLSTVYIYNVECEQMRNSSFVITGNKSQVLGCVVDRTNTDGDANGYGIFINNRSDCIVSGNQIDDNGGNMIWGIFESGGAASNNMITGNRVQDGQTGQISATATGTMVRDNVGYVTENYGTGSIASGTTAKVVAHGCDAAPTKVNIEFREQGTNDYGRWWVSSIDGTNFTLNVSADPGASGLDFAWEALAR